MERYSLRLKRSASREVEDLPTKKDRRLVVDRISKLADNPRSPGSAKLAGDDRYRVRQVAHCPALPSRSRAGHRGGRDAKRRSRGLGIEPALLRVGLCPAEHRARQLSCAHTTARYALENAILALRDHGALSEGESHALQAQLGHVSETIHQTDWSKGEAEARRALMKERTARRETPVLEAPEGERRIAELVERHQGCVEPLRNMRDQVLQQRLDAALLSRGGDPESPARRRTRRFAAVIDPIC